MRTVPPGRLAVVAMIVGLGCTDAAVAVPYIDHATGHLLAAHIRDGYPTDSDRRIDSAVTAYLVILTVVGFLGVLGWLTVICAVRADRRWAPWAAGVLFVLGLAAALCGLLVKDTSGEVGLAPLLGWVELAQCLPGLVSVLLLCRRGAQHAT